jgi:sortase A
MTQAGAMKKKYKVIIILLLIAGLGISLYPSVSNAWNSYRDSRLITKYSDSVASEEKDDIDEYFKAAEEYNESLIGSSVPAAFAARDGVRDEKYESLLNVNGDGVIGYVTIPVIDVSLPIYHYTTDDVLAKGAGHLFGSSLPIGEDSEHAVISAHRGLPSAKMFTDLNLLEEGDTFEIHVLNRTITYEVDQIKTVEPNDTSDLAIEEGKDYVTLLTCTPYGVNSERLLVRGHRISNDDAASEEEIEERQSEVKKHHNPSFLSELICILIGAGIGILIFMLLRKLTGRKKK